MTNDPLPIAIKVSSQFLEVESDVNRQRFAFKYTISIHNNSDESAQLLNRHWVITDATNSVQEISGAGVVGQQPRILPGQSYTYSSGAILKTEAGTMEGAYEMQTDRGEKFMVPIPVFSLIRPQSLH